MLLYIVRHADPVYETDSLTEKGKVQAEAVAKRLNKSGVDRVFSSPYGRAKETADYTCNLLEIDKNIEEWTREVHISQMDAESKRVKEYGEEFLMRLGYQKENEGYRILYENNERVALFCHGAFIIVWLAELLSMPLDIMLQSFTVTHTGVTVIEFPNDDSGITVPKCLCFSDISHLYAENLELLHDNRIEI